MDPEDNIEPEVIDDAVQVEDQAQETDAPEEVTVTIGDEEAPNPEEDETKAPEWVRELRKKNREDQKRIRELEDQLKGAKPDHAAATSPSVKPTLEDCDFDSEVYEQKLTEWFERKRKADEAAEKAEEAAKAQQTAWQSKLDAYGQAKAALKVPDYDEAEATAQDLFNVTQQGIIVQGADNAAMVIYALGKNPKKAKELGAITDPVKFAFAIAKLETQLKVTSKRTAPAPEKVITGTGRTSGGDSTLDRLRAEAEKTGDYSKVVAYKRNLARK